MPIVWDFGPAASTDSAAVRAEYRAALDGPLADGGGHGDVDAAFAAPGESGRSASTRFPIWRTRRWSRSTRPRIGGQTASTSGWARKLPSRRSRYAAKAGGVDPKAVFVHNCFLGGGFGRRAVNDELTQAVEVSKALGRPIKLIWTREEDIRVDRYRPQAALRMRAALRADGSPAGFDFRPRSARSRARSAGARSRTGSSARRSKASPTVPIAPDALKVGVNLKNTHVPVMFWRSVGSSQNAFAVESFIDECAHAAKRDPLEYRRALLAGPARFPRRARHARRQGRLGQAVAEGRRARRGDPRGLRHDRRRDRRGRGQRPAARSRFSASSPASTAATSSIRSPPRCRSRARCSTA